jgi:hypothetical protein
VPHVGIQRQAWVALLLASALLAVLASAAAAATREPLARALEQARYASTAIESAAPPDPAALRAMVRDSAARFAAAGNEFEISSSYYGPAEVASVADTLRSLDHGPEMAALSVYVATPEEIAQICGASVVACYLPAIEEMVVSGADASVAGVPHDFAIAHEYGHHIANSQPGSALPALEAGTIRWATYERVCQLTRSGRLFPGDQGTHYWEDPVEAFAQSYARLNRPTARVSWQYTPLLQPTATSLEKIHADVTRPWSGPVTVPWSGSVRARPAEAEGAAPAGADDGEVGIGPGRALGPPSWVDSRLLSTPLDGPVSVSLQAPPGTAVVVSSPGPGGNRDLATALTDASEEATLAYSNCGHAALRLEVRADGNGGPFQAVIARP